jgi:hypothetical protein
MGVVIIWVFKGCGYVLGILGVRLCYGYLRGVAMVFKRCGYAMGI